MIKSTYRFPKGELSEKFTNYLERQTAKYTIKSEGKYNLFIVYGDNFNINKFARKLELEYSLGDECFEDFKAKIHDETADEVIDLINRASLEGKTYTWLNNRIPEFFNTVKGDSHGEYVFPTSKVNNKVYLKKPTTLWEDLKDKFTPIFPDMFDILKQYKELKDKYSIIDDKSLTYKISQKIQETDSKKEEMKLREDYDEAEKLNDKLENLLSRTSIFNSSIKILLLDYCPTNIKELEKCIENFYNENQREWYKQSKKEKVVKLSENNRVLPLSKDQENYIRKIIGNSDTKEWAKKREEREEIPYVIRRETNKFACYSNAEDRRELRETYNPEKALYNKYKIDLKDLLIAYKNSTQEKLNYNEVSELKHILHSLSYSSYADITKEEALSTLNKALDFARTIDHSSKESKELYQRIKDLLENFKEEMKEVRKPLRVPDRRFKRN